MKWTHARAFGLAALRRYRAVWLWAGWGGALLLFASSAVCQWQIRTDNRIIADLQAGHDVDVASSARAEVLLARVLSLLERGRVDDALPLVETLAATRSGESLPPHPQLAADALYSMGNARMRQALALLERGGLSEATAPVRLAKDAYIRALRLTPQHWDAKYNLDVASRLVRDFPVHEQDEEGDPPDPLTRLWTELPGLPRGFP